MCRSNPLSFQILNSKPVSETQENHPTSYDDIYRILKIVYQNIFKHAIISAIKAGRTKIAPEDIEYGLSRPGRAMYEIGG